jgi:uncharacterized protein (TIGR03083 family)
VSLVPVDWDATRGSLDRNARVIADLLRRATPKAAEKVPGLDWTTSELGAHLVTEPRRFERLGRGSVETLDDVAGQNRAELEAVGETHPERLADIFLAEHASFMSHAAKHAATDPFSWFGWEMEWSEAAGIYLGELCIHALDLSRLVGAPWRMEREDAVRVIAGLVRILPGFVDKEAAGDFTGTYELRLRKGPSMVIAFDRGEASVSAKDGQRADCVINADPVAFLLVGYGRVSQWGPILRGKILAMGPKPWLGLKFSKLLVNP